VVYLDIKIKYAHSSNFNKLKNKQNKYIVIHFTANDGDTDEGNGSYFSRPNIKSSAHCFVDEDSVTQSVRFEDVAWHCGANKYYHPYCRNFNSIGIEMCSDKNKGVYYISDETVDRTIELTKYVMKKYNIPVENVLRHFDVTHKNCPEPFVRNERLWIKFKERLQQDNVKKEEEEEMVKRYNTYKEIPEWGKSAVSTLINKNAFADVNKLDLTDDMIRMFVFMKRADLLK